MRSYDYLLKVENLTVEAKGVKVLDNINLKVKKNEIYGVLGHNGAGKSSLAYALMGLNGYKATSGRILYKGKDITNMNISERAKLGIALTWQEPVRFEGMTVREYLELSPLSVKEDTKKYLSIFGLNPELYMGRNIDSSLSGGERKRIELAAVFAMNPELVILDEPDSGIDIHGVKNLKQNLKEKGSLDRAIIIITHQEEIVDLSDKVSVICRGKIDEEGNRDMMLDYFNKKCRGCTKNEKEKS